MFKFYPKTGILQEQKIRGQYNDVNVNYFIEDILAGIKPKIEVHFMNGEKRVVEPLLPPACKLFQRSENLSFCVKVKSIREGKLQYFYSTEEEARSNWYCGELNPSS